MGLFYLLTLYCFIRYAESELPGSATPATFGVAGLAEAGGTRKRFAVRIWACLSVAACFAGMATKEVMVTAPLMVLLYDRCFIAGSIGAAWRRRRGCYLALGSSWILLLALLPGLTSRGVGGAPGFPWGRQVLANVINLGRYWRLALWPHPLVLDYGTVELDLPAGSAAYFAVALGFAALTLWALAARPAAGFLLAWFFVILLPTTSIVPLLEQPLAEHRLYLALAGPIALAAISARDLIARRAGRSGDYLFLALVAVVALLFGALTLKRNDDYRSALSIWRDTAAKIPDNPRARRSLGSALLASNRFAEAADEFRVELRLRPDAGTYYLLGTALAKSGKWAEAEAQYELALGLKPDYAEDQSDLGLALVRLGRFDQANGHFRQALRLRPRSPEVHVNLGNIAFIQGRYAEAVAEYRAALDIDPGYAAAQKNLQLAEKASKR
jgi:Flp pilus assembly protein TadD